MLLFCCTVYVAKLPFRGGLTDRRDIHMSIVMSGSLPPFGIRIKLSPALSSFSVVRQRCLRYTHTMPTQAAEVLETSSASRSTEYYFDWPVPVVTLVDWS